MRDKRPVDELSTEELERILMVRKREARMSRLRQHETLERRMLPPASSEARRTAESGPDPAELEHQQVQSIRELTLSHDRVMPLADEWEVETRSRWAIDAVKFRWNRILLVVEVVVTLGIGFALIGLLLSLQNINQMSANVQFGFQATMNARLIPPTATALINIASVVLPDGHTVSVNDNGEAFASFNLDEVPAQFREQYRIFMAQPPLQVTASVEGPVRIRIPTIKVDSAVVSGDSWEPLKLGVGHHVGSALPGQRGNMVLTGHNDVYGEVFRYLDQLEPGDTIVVSSISRDYVYIVQDRQIVKPDAVWVMDSRGDAKQLTLISCYPYRVDNKRIVIFAMLQS